LKNKQLVSFQLLVEGIGAVFSGVFLAAYLLALPSNDVLHTTPIYHELLAIFGGLFLVLILASLVLSAMIKRIVK
jgi:hypothetical protein